MRSLTDRELWAHDLAEVASFPGKERSSGVFKTETNGVG
jgi:hypothetical protein